MSLGRGVRAVWFPARQELGILPPMELTDRFELGVPLDDAWALLVDLERVAPCVPGAELREVEAGDHRGVVRVRAGPLVIEYRGAARFVDLDRAAHRIVLRAEGGDSRGHENGCAVVTATLRPAGPGTEVELAIDLALAGRVAHMARGVVSDVGAKLVAQFAGCLSSAALAPESPTGPAGGAAGTAAAVAVRAPPAPPVDLLALAGGSLAKRALPALTSMGAMWLLRRRRHGHRAG
jgi:carbon monoxide dehydrogenase subunit G